MSVPPDILAALQGGGAPAAGPAPGGGGLPPDILAALGGGGGPEVDQAPDQAQDVSATGDTGTHGGADPFIRDAIDSLTQAAQAEADEQDIVTIQTCIANLQKVLANNQSDQDSMLQGKANPRAIRKATAGQGY